MKFFIILTIFLCLYSTPSQAAIITFEINKLIDEKVGARDLDTVVLNLGREATLFVDEDKSSSTTTFRLNGSGTISTIETEVFGYHFLESYQSDEMISPVNFGFHKSSRNDLDVIEISAVIAGPWVRSHSGFLGFVTNENYFGWLRYDYKKHQSYSFSRQDITLLDGAYQSTPNLGIRAGSVSVSSPQTIVILLLGLLLTAGRKVSIGRLIFNVLT